MMDRTRRLLALLLLCGAATAHAVCDSTLIATTTPRLQLSRPVTNQCNWDLVLQAFIDRVDLKACFPGVACGVTLGADTVGVLPPSQGGLGIAFTPAAQTVDLKQLLVNLGLYSSTPGVTPLNLGTGAVTCGSISVGTAVTCSSLNASGPVTANTLTVAQSVVAGAGLQHQRTSPGCTTTATQFNTCTTTVTWTSAFADANYTAVCWCDNLGSGHPIFWTSARVASSITITTEAETANVAQCNRFACIGMHD